MSIPPLFGAVGIAVVACDGLDLRMASAHLELLRSLMPLGTVLMAVVVEGIYNGVGFGRELEEGVKTEPRLTSRRTRY